MIERMYIERSSSSIIHINYNKTSLTYIHEVFIGVHEVHRRRYAYIGYHGAMLLRSFTRIFLVC